MNFKELVEKLFIRFSINKKSLPQHNKDPYAHYKWIEIINCKENFILMI